jgi:hypothetical protein
MSGKPLGQRENLLATGGAPLFDDVAVAGTSSTAGTNEAEQIERRGERSLEFGIAAETACEFSFKGFQARTS